MSREPFTMTLVSAEMLTPRVKHFTFRKDDGPLNYLPGQFITLLIPHGEKKLRRSYSIANTHGQQIIEFAASYVEDGVASQHLFGLQPGDQVTATGPFGKLVLKTPHPKRYILVSTNTGITPYRAMLPSFADLFAQNIKVVVLQGVRAREDVIYEQDFLSLSQEKSFEFIQHLSREEEVSNSHERIGRLHESLKQLQLNPNDDRVYLCGNPEMVDEAYQWLKSIEFGNQSIVREKYLSTNH